MSEVFYRPDSTEENPLPDHYRRSLDTYLNRICQVEINPKDALEVLRYGMHGLEGRLQINWEKQRIEIKNKETIYLLLAYDHSSTG